MLQPMQEILQQEPKKLHEKSGLGKNCTILNKTPFNTFHHCTLASFFPCLNLGILTSWKENAYTESITQGEVFLKKLFFLLFFFSFTLK